jgi:hypothetical protein
MLDVWYKDHYFDADKQGLREMLHTQLDNLKTHSDRGNTQRTEEKRPWTDRAETSLLDMYDEILDENETN